MRYVLMVVSLSVLAFQPIACPRQPAPGPKEAGEPFGAGERIGDEGRALAQTAAGVQLPYPLLACAGATVRHYEEDTTTSPDWWYVSVCLGTNQSEEEVVAWYVDALSSRDLSVSEKRLQSQGGPPITRLRVGWTRERTSPFFRVFVYRARIGHFGIKYALGGPAAQAAGVETKADALVSIPRDWEPGATP